jgi:hypothetical protein
MRLDDLQGESGRRRRVEGVAAALEHRHRHGAGDPMRARDRPEGPANFRPGCKIHLHPLGLPQLPKALRAID